MSDNEPHFLQVLLSAGASLVALDSMGWTALDLAEKNQHEVQSTPIIISLIMSLINYRSAFKS